MYYLFMDLETTEKYPTEWNNIVEIGAILYDIENDLEIDRFHKLCYPKSGKISEEASAITGYTIQMLKQYEHEDEVLLEFAAWAGLHKMDGNILWYSQRKNRYRNSSYASCSWRRHPASKDIWDFISRTAR